MSSDASTNAAAPPPVPSVAGLIAAGTGVTITGSGTAGSPYSIAASGGGASSSGAAGLLQVSDGSGGFTSSASVSEETGTVTAKTYIATDTTFGYFGHANATYVLSGIDPNNLLISNNPSNRLLVCEAAASQTADLVQYQGPTGSVLSAVDCGGYHRMVTGSGAPTSTPADGAIYVDTTNSKLYVRTGGAWKSASLT